MHQNNPAIPVNTLLTMYDLPSADPEEISLIAPEMIAVPSSALS